MKTSTTFPHPFEMGGNRVKEALQWCEEQGYVRMKDYLVVTDRNSGYIYFKDGDHAMMFKLANAKRN
jgi:hypothetical protein